LKKDKKATATAAMVTEKREADEGVSVGVEVGPLEQVRSIEMVVPGITMWSTQPGAVLLKAKEAAPEQSAVPYPWRIWAPQSTIREPSPRTLLGTPPMVMLSAPRPPMQLGLADDAVALCQ